MTTKDEECDYKLKVVLAGSTGVGKTNLVLRYTLATFNCETSTTIGVEFKAKLFRTNEGKVIKVQMWDTAGQERFRYTPPHSGPSPRPIIKEPWP